MANIIDTRGRSCPEPVIMTKEALDKGIDKQLKILADSQVAVENISRFIRGKAYNIDIEEDLGDFTLTIRK